MRRVVVALVILALVVGGLWWWSVPPRPRHVIVVSLDTTRADVLGPYGFDRAHTPNIDAFAGDAVLFERHYSAAPTTLASHTSLFTGNHPHTHGVPRNDYEVNSRNRMLAEILKEAGFSTAAILGAMPLASHSNFTQGFDHVDESFTKLRTQDKTGQTERDGSEVSQVALAWLDEHQEDEHVFMFVHYFDAHAPYDPLPEFRKLYNPDDTIERAGQMGQIARVQQMYRQRDPDAKRMGDTLRELYLGGVATVDHHLGALLDGLAERGMLDDTLIIITADHGETFDTHDEYFDHGETVYDETVHTPLIVRFPGAWHGGWRIADVVGNVDIVPTVLDLLGIEPTRTDGQSIVELMRGLPWASHALVYTEATKPHIPDQKGWQNAGMQKAVVDDAWKLILDPRAERSELYNVVHDPGEEENRKKNEADRARSMEKDLSAWSERAKPLPSPRISGERQKAELALLGYVEETPGEAAEERRSEREDGRRKHRDEPTEAPKQ